MADNQRQVEVVYRAKFDEYKADIAQINALTESTDEKTRQVNQSIQRSFVQTGEKLKGAFQIDQVNKRLGEVEVTAGKVALEIKSIFENTSETGKNTAVSLKDIQEGLEANAATAIKTQKEFAKLSVPSQNISKPSQFNVKDQLVPAVNTSNLKVGQAETTKLAGAFKNAKSELKALTDQLASNKLSGEPLQQAIMRAAELRDNISDTNQLVNSLASDTRGIDAIVTGAQGLAAGFSVAAGAVSLFSSNSEEAQVATQKVQGALAVLLGVQQLAKIATDKNALSIGGLSLAQKANAAATVGATRVLALFGKTAETSAISLKVLRGAIIATGIGLLVALLATLVSSLGEGADAADEFGDSLDKNVTGAIEASTTALNAYIQANLNLQLAQGKISEQQKQITEIEIAKAQALEKSDQERKAQIDEINKSLADQKELLVGFKDQQLFLRFGIVTSDFQKYITEANNANDAIDVVNTKRDQERIAIETKAVDAIAATRIKTNEETAKKLIDLDRQRVNAEIAAERAKIKFIIEASKEGTEFNHAAKRELIEFELMATQRLLDLELKERKKALKESGVATKADYAALNAEIQNRRTLAEKETNNQLTKLTQDYLADNLKEYQDFLDRVKQIEIDAIKVREELVKAANESYNEARFSEELKLAGSNQRRILAAEINNIKAVNAERDKPLKDEAAKFQQRLDDIGFLTDEEILKYEDVKNKRIKIKNDELAAIKSLEDAYFQQLTQTITSSTLSVANSIFQITTNFRDQQIKSIEEQKESDLENSELTAEQRVRIEELAAGKISEIRLQQAEQDKAAAIFTAFINVAEGVTSALSKANIPLAVLIASLGALEIAAIATKPLPKFKKGKIGIEGEGTETSDSILAQISRGESVINAKSTRESKSDLIAINKSRAEYLKHLRDKYVMPELYADRLRNGLSERDRSKSSKESKIIFKTDRLEKRVSTLTRQTKAGSDQIVDAIKSGTVNHRSIW